MISEWRVENFYFSKESDGTKTAACVYGKKGKALAAPTEYWYIDEQGFLCISPVPTKTLLTQKVTKIGKMFIDEENGILNAHRNSGEAQYRHAITFIAAFTAGLVKLCARGSGRKSPAFYKKSLRGNHRGFVF